MSEVTSTMAGDGDAATPEASGGGLVLVSVSPEAKVARAFPLSRGSALAGREPPRGGWVIDQVAVSRVHASLTATGRGTLRVRDLGSRNGTLVNGERVTETEARPADVVRIGDAVFVVVGGDAEAHLPFALGAPAGAHGLAGGLSMARLLATIQGIARGEATVLVQGETGTGKELVARALHAESGRSGAFIALNCAAIPAGLVEAELFGHERGAFTGAVRASPGLVRAAQGGTLLLDEIGEMPPGAQAKVLRLLESREVLPVGATSPVHVDVRIVCATHRDLRSRVDDGTFRADLYARIAQRRVVVPPLRERKEDLVSIVRAVLARTPGAHPTPGVGFFHKLALHDWPFNVRELVAAVEHAAEQARGAELQASHLPELVPARLPRSTPGAAQAATPPRRKSPSCDQLRALLARETGNVTAVARALERDPAQIYRWMRQFGIRPEEFR